MPIGYSHGPLTSRQAPPVSRRLPYAIREQILMFPEWRIGAHRVTVTLDDGRRIDGVIVAWGGDIIRVDDSEHLTFEAEQVVGVAHDATT